MTAPRQFVAEQADQQFDAAVGHRRNLRPERGDLRDSQFALGFMVPVIYALQ